jgi:hypothetical protein
MKNEAAWLAPVPNTVKTEGGLQGQASRSQVHIMPTTTGVNK